MPELYLQRFLRFPVDFDVGHTAFSVLKDKYGITATRHGRYPNLLLFKYSQIASPREDLMVQECRGLILDEARDWAVVAMPYTRFFNLGEGLAADINWATARVWEKLDGSLMTLYYYGGAWHVSTSGVPDATCKVGDFDISFNDLFWKTAKAQGLRTELLNPDCCYMLELCAPQNRVVVRYPEARLYLHGVRDVRTLRERMPFAAALNLGIPTPRWWDLGSAEACIAAAKDLNPLEVEGYVVCDAEFRRIKVKSPAYIILHHARDFATSRKKMALLIRDGETSEFETALSDFPELRADFEKLKTAYAAYCQTAEAAMEVYGGIEDRKEFALKVKDLPVAPALFALKSKKAASAREFMTTLTVPAYLRALSVPDTEPQEQLQ